MVWRRSGSYCGKRRVDSFCTVWPEKSTQVPDPLSGVHALYLPRVVSAAQRPSLNGDGGGMLARRSS